MSVFLKLLMALFFGVKRHWHILFAILLGFTFGYFFYENQLMEDSRGVFVLQFFEFVGQVFIRLINMIVIPLVVSSLIVGAASVKDARQLGRMGGKVFSLFLLFMVISAVIGAGLTAVVDPGDNLRQNIESISANLAASQTIDVKNFHTDVSDIKNLVLELIPINPVQALANMNLVPAIMYTLLLGFALAFIGPAGKPLIAFFESLFTATMKMTDWIMMMAVPGVFALAFVTVATTGTDVFINLLPFVGVVLVGILVQLVIVYPILLQALARVDAMNLYRSISEAMLVAFGTASSSATLPITIANCEMRAGISNRVASFVLPTGASINKTGTTMFEVMAVMFLLQAYGVTMEWSTVIMIVVLSIVASVAAAAVPSAGLITLSLIITGLGSGMTLGTFSAGVAALWAIDRGLDMCRTVCNVVSSVSVAAIVAASEGELKRDVLNNPAAWKETM